MSASQLNLSLRLREFCKEVHRKAEDHPFNQRIMGKSSDKIQLDDYIIYFSQRHFLYSELTKTILDQDPLTICDNTASFLAGYNKIEESEKDLNACLEGARRDIPDVLTATTIFINKIKTAEPLQLLMYSYVLYLADLHGGQILKPMIEKDLQELTQRNISLQSLTFANRNELMGKMYGFVNALKLNEAEISQCENWQMEAYTLFEDILEAMENLRNNNGAAKDAELLHSDEDRSYSVARKNC